eukprot:1640460-Karenia_brevis.AAC.1
MIKQIQETYTGHASKPGPEVVRAFPAQPFHHDAHFYSTALQQRQNTSVIASFGATRMLTFKNV